jgi:hypothetical protein
MINGQMCIISSYYKLPVLLLLKIWLGKIEIGLIQEPMIKLDGSKSFIGQSGILID